jgi:hypothetical protein
MKIENIIYGMALMTLVISGIFITANQQEGYFKTYGYVPPEYASAKFDKLNAIDTKLTELSNALKPSTSGLDFASKILNGATNAILLIYDVISLPAELISESLIELGLPEIIGKVLKIIITASMLMTLVYLIFRGEPY